MDMHQETFGTMAKKNRQAQASVTAIMAPQWRRKA